MKLLITEKKPVAKKLADAMGYTYKDGYYVGKLDGEELRVVWARGHLLSYETPDEITPDLGWDNPRGLETIPREFNLIPLADPKGTKTGQRYKDYLNNIERNLKNCSEVIIGTDADREGETIGWMLLDYFNYKGPVRRAWFAAGVDKKSLTQAMNNILPPQERKSMYRAGEARGRADWSFIYLTRANTFYGRRAHFGTNLGVGDTSIAKVVSVGRVQTPSLGLMVRREKEINSFTAVDHFSLSAVFAGISCAYRPKVSQSVIDSNPAGVTWVESSRIPKNENDVVLDDCLFTGKQEIDAFVARLQANADRAVLTEYKVAKNLSNPPKTFSLATGQAEIAAKLGVSPTIAQEIISDLYQLDYISYPRTTEADLPINLYELSELKSMLGAVEELPEFTSQVKEALAIHTGKHPTIKKFVPAVFVERDLAHYGLVPTSKRMTEAGLDLLEPVSKKAKYGNHELRESYKIIVRQYIQALYPPAEYDKTSITVTVPVVDMLGCPETVFSASGKVLVNSGWLNAFSSSATKSVVIPHMEKGNVIPLGDVKVTSQRTKPPKRYNTLTIISALENVGRNVKDPALRKMLRDTKGIGTPATRTGIIENLIARGYVKLVKDEFIPTQKGIDLIEIVATSWLREPETTAIWEDFLLKIENEKDDAKAIMMRDQFVSSQIDSIEKMIKEMNDRYEGNIGRVQGSVPETVTESMKRRIKIICDYGNIQCDSDTQTDPEKAIDFLRDHKAVLDEYYQNRDQGPASEAQIKLLNTRWSLIDDEAKASVGGMEAFKVALGKYSEAVSFIDLLATKVPASEAQMKLVRMLADKLKTKPDLEHQWSVSEATMFIDKHGKKGRGKGKTTGKRTASTGKRRVTRRTAK